MTRKHLKVQIYARTTDKLIRETDVFMSTDAGIWATTAAFQTYLEALMASVYPKAVGCSNIFDPNVLVYCRFWEVL